MRHPKELFIYSLRGLTAVSVCKHSNLLIFLVGCEFLLISPVYPSVFYSRVEAAENSGVLSSEKIKGRVTNKNGESIPQAIIAATVDQYSNNIVQSDSTGYFEIMVDDRSTALVVSAIGYLPRELALSEFKGKDHLAVSLEINPDFTLDEVEVSAKRQEELKPFALKRLLLPLAGTKEEKDVTDYFALGHTHDDLLKLFLNHLDSLYKDISVPLKWDELNN